LREAQNGEITQIAQRQHFPKENCGSPPRNYKYPAITILDPSSENMVYFRISRPFGEYVLVSHYSPTRS